MGRQVSSQESRALSCIIVNWEDKCLHSESSLLPSFPSFMCPAWCHMVWESLWSAGVHLYTLCTTPGAPPASSLMEWGEAEKALLCSATTRTSLNYQHFPSQIQNRAPTSHCEKCNSIPVKLSTKWKGYCHLIFTHRAVSTKATVMLLNTVK